MKENDIHIGKLIETVFNSRNMTKAEFARSIHTSRQNITTLFDRPDIDVKRLFTISQVLDYDFMQHFAIKKEEINFPETEISIQMKVKSSNIEDLLKWLSDNGNINMTLK